MTKKEEFEEIFIEEATIKETGEQFRYIEYDDELWKWIETEIRQAKIGENKYHIQKINKSQEQFPTVLDSERVIAMKEVFANRISELEGEIK
jgi:hypothetical protein